MSDEETAFREWKTIRIAATSYYKLAELSGLLTAVLGTKVPMSVVAAWAITCYHNDTYPNLKKIMVDPDRIEQIRRKWKEVEGRLRQLSDVLTKPGV